jgi:hypothetical protein
MKKDIQGLFLGIIAGIFIFGGWVNYQVSSNQSKNFEDWVKILRIDVPNHELGKNPIIVFSAESRKNAILKWKTVVKSSEAPLNVVCETAGNDTYIVGQNREYVKLNELVSSDCKMNPGEYFLTYEAVIEESGYGEKRFVKTSNIFNVK